MSFQRLPALRPGDTVRVVAPGDGMLASIYNAMPLESVNTLVEFMRGFEKRTG
jgi:phosphoserine aminotransferase